MTANSEIAISDGVFAVVADNAVGISLNSTDLCILAFQGKFYPFFGHVFHSILL
jgi:hypothetical protein